MTTSHQIPDVASSHSTAVLPDSPPDLGEEMDAQSGGEGKEHQSAYYLDLLQATCKSLDLQQQQQQSQSGSSSSSQTTVAAGAAAARISFPSSSSSSQPDIVASMRHESQSEKGVVTSESPGGVSEKAPEEKDDKGIYRLKWIDCGKGAGHGPAEKEKDNGGPAAVSSNNRIAIITQNENGPCPLIAIMNVLLLKGDLRLPPIMDVITADQLMEFLGDCILSNMPSNLSNGAQLNYEQNMMDAIAILPKLQTGLDVNVRFTSVTDFEFTPELIVFDLLRIPLYHGWLVDPVVDAEAAAAIGSCSYNQLVDKIINNKSSESTSRVTEGQPLVTALVSY